MKELVTFGLKVLSDECNWGSRFSNVAVYVGNRKVKHGRYVGGCELELDSLVPKTEEELVEIGKKRDLTFRDYFRLSKDSPKPIN